MKNLVLAVATVLALGTGTAFADGNVYAQPAQVTQSTQASHDASRAFANSSRSEVSVYSAFRGNGFVQGGEQ